MPEVRRIFNGIGHLPGPSPLSLPRHLRLTAIAQGREGRVTGDTSYPNIGLERMDLSKPSGYV